MSEFKHLCPPSFCPITPVFGDRRGVARHTRVCAQASTQPPLAGRDLRLCDRRRRSPAEAHAVDHRLHAQVGGHSRLGDGDTDLGNSGVTPRRPRVRLPALATSLDANAELLQAIAPTTYSKNSAAVIHSPLVPELRRAGLLGMRRLMFTPFAGIAA